MISRPLIIIKTNESEFVSIYYDASRRIAMLRIDVQVGESGPRHELDCDVPVQALRSLLSVLTDVGPDAEIDVSTSRRLLVLRRAKEAVVIVVGDVVTDGCRVRRAMRLDRWARKRLIVGLEHARVLVDPDLLSSEGAA